MAKDQTIVEKLIEMTDGGLDFTFDCTGNTKIMRDALEACHKGWGQSIIIVWLPLMKKFLQGRSSWSLVECGKALLLVASKVDLKWAV